MLKLVEHVQNMLAKVCEFFENVCGATKMRILLALAGLETLISRCFEGIFPFFPALGLDFEECKSCSAHSS